MKEKSTGKKFRITFYWIVRVIGFLLIAYSIYGLISTNDKREDSRYVFIIAQAVCLIVLSYVPVFINKIWKLSIPIGIEIFFLAYCSGGVLLGEIAEFYIKIWWWDSVLHTISGAFIACIGFVVFSLFNEKDGVPMKVSPGFLVLFVFCLSLACGLIWEIVEWTADGITGSNMQRYSDNITRVGFVGRNALRDTMKDLILDVIGAGIICVLSYIDMKTDKNYFNRYFKIEKITSKKNRNLESTLLETDKVEEE